MEIIPDDKTCTKCKLTKALSEFHKDRTKSDGCRSRCKPCSLGDKAITDQRDRDSINERRVAHYNANRDKNLEYSRQYREENKDKVTEYNRVWRENNREAFNEQQRYNRKNELAYKESNQKASIKRRARKRGVVTEEFTTADVLAKWGIDCHLCMEPVDLDAPRRAGIAEGWERGLHLDHVVSLFNSGSHTLDNVKPSHGLCNLRKNRH